ncbi:MAG TPA: TolC family protein [Terriglobales bacterium]|nr:TolC family protein [Terriglobales bacterium]
MSKLRFITGCLAACLLSAGALSAQFLPRFHVNAPRVEPIAGLHERIHDGQLHLTLKEFLALVLANDTQIHVLRLDNTNAVNAVLAARSPFDPTLIGSFNGTRSVQPEASQINGAPTLSQLGQNSNFTFNQVLGTGQQVAIGFGTNRDSSNSQFLTFNPSLGATMNFALTQPLLRNRGNLQNRTPLLIAQTQVLVVGDQTSTQIADQLVSAADQYWSTVQARDQIAVQQQGVDLAQKSYERDQNALQLGALPPGDIFTSQAQVAQDQTQLLQAQSNYRQQMDLLRRLIGADIDAEARAAEIVLDEDPRATTPEAPPLPVDQAVAQALAHRPEMDAIQRQRIEDRFSTAAARDALRPQLNLSGSYGSNALAGNAIPVVNSLGVSVGGLSTGFGSALGQVFDFGFPTYGFSLSLNLPLRNSAGRAQLSNSLVSEASHAYQERNETQQVTQEVRLADTQLSMAAAVVHSATTARDLSQKNVAAEQQKYTLGTITVFELLQAQVQLSNAELTLLGAYTSYQIAQIAYQRATWTLLDKLGLKVNP